MRLALGASIAREKDRNAADAARRAVLLETVASAAREVSGAPRAEILEAVLAAADLGRLERGGQGGPGKDRGLGDRIAVWRAALRWRV